MSMSHEEHANKLDDLLRKGGECHDAGLRPFMETAEALKRDASEDAARMDPAVARAQRDHLLSLASSMSASPKPVSSETPSSPATRERRPWILWGAGAFGAVAVAASLVAALVLRAPAQLPGPSGGRPAAPIVRLVIPEAHALDAFSLVAERQDAAGADPATAFVVSSTIPVTAQTLTQHLRVVPPPSNDGSPVEPVPVDVREIGANEFRVQPAEKLEDGKVYRIELAAAVAQPDGSLTARDFSWAVQTKNVFRVTSSVPAPNSSSVPTDTGIEVTMSMPGWEDPSPYFEMQPRVDGRFETHGRSLAFVPSKPLEPGRIYTVTYKKGWKVAGSDRALRDDVVITFETSPRMPGGAYVPPKPYINVSRMIVEAAPGRDVLVPVWLNSVAKSADVTVTGYAIDAKDATAFLVEESKIPWFAYETRRRGDVFAKYAKTKALEMKPEIQSIEYQTFLVLPKGVPAGRYVMKVEIANGDPSWFYLESTNVATYAVSDKSATLVWAMNIETGRPLTGMPVVLKDARVTTDQDGIARLATPSEVTATGTQEAVVVTVGEGALSSLVRLESRRGWSYAYEFGRLSDNDATVAYLYPDRPIYRTTDRLQAFGVIQDRASRNAASNVTLELTRNGIFDFYDWGKEKVYRKTTIAPDASGFFTASFDWKTLAPGYYTVILKTNGKRVAERSVEIRDFVKPAYTLEITTDRQAVYAGDEVVGEVRAAFFNGTPVGGLSLSLDASGAKNESMALTTDNDGRATFRIKTEKQTCDPSAENVWCPSVNALTITVRPAEGEEAQIWTTDSVDVWRSRASLEVNAVTKDDTATLTFTARRVDLSKAGTGGGQDVLADPLRSTSITGRIVEKRWERVEDGTWYDYIEKKVVPKYRYERKTRDVGTVNLTTDVQGKATMTFPMSNDVYYTVIATVKDEQGMDEYGMTTFAKGWWRVSEYQVQGISFEPRTPQTDRWGYHLGERVAVEFRKNDEPMRDAAEPSFLYVESRLGIRSAKVSNKASYEFEFSDDHVPNMRLYGVAFLTDGFVERQFDASFDSEDRALAVTITPDKDAYAPGATASVRIEAKKKDGSPASGARVGLGVVDEAVFAAAQTDGSEYPLNALYSWVSDGILLHETSHESTAEALGPGGAEMGGGGGETIRRNFKDTAAFQAVTLDANGVGTMTLTLPDNLTSWRVTAVAVTADRYAGYARRGMPVTKPVFVDVVAPSPLLTADKPVLKLRAFGTGLPADEDVTFGVDAPTLGLRNETVKGKAGTATYVGVETLPPGEHVMVMRVSSSKGSDALEKRITVVSSRFLREELVETELGPGSTLPDPGAVREADVLFVPKNRAQHLWRVRDLAFTGSQRLESKVASRLAKRLLIDAYGETKVKPDEESLARYQKTTGGLAILPYASEDAELTAKVAAVAPDAFDRTLLAKYLWDAARNQDKTREESVRAVSGLAALGEPVLTQLKVYAALNDLSWREELAVIRGLDAAGDRETARGLFERLLSKAEEADGKMFVRVADDKRSNMEATAEAATIAQAFVHPSAPKLFAWLEGQWDADTLTDLDRIAYLVRTVPSLINKDVTVGYTTGAPEQTIVLKDGFGERVTLTADEIRAFRATKVDGPAVAVYSRQIAAPPAQSRDLSLKRTYVKPDGTAVQALAENDTLLVKLEPTWQPTAPSGCYTVRDHVPAGLSPMVNLFFYEWGIGDTWYPVEVDGNAVSFIVCKPWNKDQKPETVTYRLRVVARGTYAAEPAVMQSIDAPSIAALSGSDTVTVK